MERLSSYHWPGNVRELENVIERALILSQGSPISFADLVDGGSGEDSVGHARSDEELITLDEANIRHIKEALSITGGKIHGRDGAARLLGVNPSTLRARMDKLGIRYGRRK